MTQSPSLPELPKLSAFNFGVLGDLTGSGLGAMIEGYGLACYEAGSAAAARAVPGWIGVEDQLPDERASAYLVAVIAKKTYSEGSNYPGMGIRSVVQDWVARNYASSYTHWMALPEITPAAPTQGAEGAAPQAVVGEASESDKFGGQEGYRFRTWAAMSRTPPLDIRCMDSGDYISMETRGAWSAWQYLTTPTAPQEADALREAALIEAADALFDFQEIGGFVPKANREEFRELCGAAIVDYLRLAALAQHQPQQGEQRGTVVEKIVRAEPWLKSAEVQERIEGGK